MQNWEELLSWTYSGVNFSLAGNGGPECVALVPGMQKIVETVFVLALNSLQLWMVFPKLRLGKQPPMTTAEGGGEVGRRIVLLVMCLTFGVELGFKFASRQMIWVLNPCHIVTMIQIFLLAAPPSDFAATLFRLHVHWLSGATIALAFPVLNTRMLPFEVHIYFVQHILMLVVPLYLTRLGVYAVEPVRDFSWSTAGSAILFVYHFVPLQLIGLLLQVNLNNMLCPAISDPFYGRWYRVYAIIHQSLFVLLHGKLYTFLAHSFAQRKKTRDVVTANGFSKID